MTHDFCKPTANGHAPQCSSQEAVSLCLHHGKAQLPVDTHCGWKQRHAAQLQRDTAVGLPHKSRTSGKPSVMWIIANMGPTSRAELLARTWGAGAARLMTRGTSGPGAALRGASACESMRFSKAWDSEKGHRVYIMESSYREGRSFTSLLWELWYQLKFGLLVQLTSPSCLCSFPNMGHWKTPPVSEKI